MKKIMITMITMMIMVVLTSCSSNSSEKSTVVNSDTTMTTNIEKEVKEIPVEPVTITTEYDEMKDKTYYFASRNLICSEDGTNGFLIQPMFSYKNGKLTMDKDLIVTGQWDGIKCVEGGKLIVKFTDGTKSTMTNWKDFNCEGTFYFTMTKTFMDKIKTTTIEKIYVENGRNFSSFTYDFKEPSKYFIELCSAVDNYKK